MNFEIVLLIIIIYNLRKNSRLRNKLFILQEIPKTRLYSTWRIYKKFKIFSRQIFSQIWRSKYWMQAIISIIVCGERNFIENVGIDKMCMKYFSYFARVWKWMNRIFFFLFLIKITTFMWMVCLENWISINGSSAPVYIFTLFPSTSIKRKYVVATRCSRQEPNRATSAMPKALQIITR
jgi:hypothetical protein